MALENSDVFVLQKTTGDQENFKLSVADLIGYVQNSDVIQFKGSRDFTDLAEDPQVDGTGVIQGDTYMHNGAEGAATWNDMSGTVSPGDRALWDSTSVSWILIKNDGQGVISIDATLPITVDEGDASNPVVGVNEATTTSSGVVKSLATVADISSNSTTAVVTADLINTINTGVLTISGVEPIVINNAVTSAPVVTINEATTTTTGYVRRLARAGDVDPDQGTGSNKAVVTSDLLNETNAAVAAIEAGGITGIDGGIYAS